MGNVYPHINITEEEELQYKDFDVTENTVLVPLLYGRTFKNKGTVLDPEYEYTDDPLPAEYFSNAKKFLETMAVGAGLSSEGTGSLTRVVNCDGIQDKSYLMAYNLLNSGLNVVVKYITIDPEDIKLDSEGKFSYTTGEYEEILEEKISSDELEEFSDKNIFNIKFITSGAYPNIRATDWNSEGNPISNTNTYSKLADIAKSRGDAVAIVEYSYGDITNKKQLSWFQDNIPTSAGSFDTYKYSCCFAPWCFDSVSVPTVVKKGSGYSVSTESVTLLMPAGYNFLMAYANSIQTNANWFAAAGVSRGYIPGLVKPLFEIGESLKNKLQGYTGDSSADVRVRINPIMYAGTYGYKIWGNKVFVSSGSAVTKQLYQDFLNVRILLCDIKKQIYHTCMRLSFEPNDDIVWLNFKSLTSTLFEKMKSGRGLSWYRWYKEEADDKATIKAKLKIKPIEAVEAFDVTVSLTDEEASVEEE